MVPRSFGRVPSWHAQVRGELDGNAFLWETAGTVPAIVDPARRFGLGARLE